MKFKTLPLACLLIISQSYAAQSDPSTTLRIVERESSYRLSVPVSRLVMTIPKKDWKLEIQSAPAASSGSRYFSLMDRARGLVVSGWFESADGFRGIEKFWESESKSYLKPENVSFTHADSWQVIAFDVALVPGSSISVSHIRAEWVQAGTWIDIHASFSSERPSAERRATLMEILKTIQVEEVADRAGADRNQDTASSSPAPRGTYLLPGHGELQLQVPGEWKDSVRRPPNDLPPTITFSENSGPPFKVMITPLWKVNQPGGTFTDDELRGIVSKSAERAQSKAVEKTLEIKDLTGSSGRGYYFAATDRAPAPGEFKYLTQGALRVGELAVVFTVLTNDGQNQVVLDTMTVVSSAAHVHR